MKITRLIRGFRIGCSDAEFELLRLVTARGLKELTNSPTMSTLSLPAQRTLYGGRFGDHGDLLRVDVDRRESAVAYGGVMETANGIARD